VLSVFLGHGVVAPVRHASWGKTIKHSCATPS
jgi:hypothetical protein